MSSYQVEVRKGGIVADSGVLAFTDASNQPTAAPFQLSQTASSGATTANLGNAPSLLAAGSYIAIGAGTPTAGLRRIVSMAGSVATLDRALTTTYGAGTNVQLLYGPTLIPWSMWGGKASNSQSDATTNTTAFNNLTQEIYHLGATFGMQWGIGVDPGNFYVNGELKPERDQALRAASTQASQILAADSFPFTTDGSVAVIHPQRDGSPVLYHSLGPSGRWFFDNLYVNCRGLANSNAILTSPQQPDKGRNLRVQGAAGLYGLSINDCQVYGIDNFEADSCALPLDFWQARFIPVTQANITSTTGAVMVQLTDSQNIHFDTGDFETMTASGTIFNATGATDRLQFDNLYTSGFANSTGDFLHFDCPSANPGGFCNYVINDLFCNQNASTVNMVRDVQRSITLNSFADTNRKIMQGWAQDAAYWYTVAGGKVKTNVTYIT